MSCFCVETYKCDNTLCKHYSHEQEHLHETEGFRSSLSISPGFGFHIPYPLTKCVMCKNCINSSLLINVCLSGFITMMKAGFLHRSLLLVCIRLVSQKIVIISYPNFTLAVDKLFVSLVVCFLWSCSDCMCGYSLEQKLHWIVKILNNVLNLLIIQSPTQDINIQMVDLRFSWLLWSKKFPHKAEFTSLMFLKMVEPTDIWLALYAKCNYTYNALRELCYVNLPTYLRWCLH